MEKFDFDSTSKTGTWNTESEIQIPETGLNLTTDSQKASADDIVVEKKVLYRLVETEAPTGYTIDSTPIYMMFGTGGSDESLSDLKKEIKDNGLQSAFCHSFLITTVVSSISFVIVSVIPLLI